MMEFHEKVIRVAFLASEADPLIKVGGLGDVAGSLPAELNLLPSDLLAGFKLDVRLFLPYHHQIQTKITPQRIDQFSV